MQITDEKIRKFQKIYKRKTGEDLTEAEALNECTQLVQTLVVIFKEMAKMANAEKLLKTNTNNNV
ncbi:MAG: hypothetical protein WCO30_02420 [bacterium]